MIAAAKSLCWVSICIVCWLALVGAVSARADLLVLTNGDSFSGAVVSMSQTTVEFRSDSLGMVKIPRDKVARIGLRDAAAKPEPGSSGTNGVTPAPRSLVAARTNGVNAAVQQLRQQGADAKLMNQIQQQVLGDSSPEANRLFTQMVAGLTSGSLTAEDIRAQARKAIKDIQTAKTDLGEDDAIGELLNGYLGVLQSFVQESEEPAPVTAKPLVKPPSAGNLSGAK